MKRTLADILDDNSVHTKYWCMSDAHYVNIDEKIIGFDDLNGGRLIDFNQIEGLKDLGSYIWNYKVISTRYFEIISDFKLARLGE